jgi:hypothetical protein
MTRIEQRKIERYPLEQQPDGRLVLRVESGRHAIREIRDISDSGISFLLDCQVAASSSVAIEYADPALQLEVYGRVAWCAQRPSTEQLQPLEPQFIVGVELLSPLTLYSVLQKH